MRKIDPKTFEPLSYLVLVKEDTVEEKTKGGVILPDASKDANGYQQQFGELVSMGPLAFTRNDDGVDVIQDSPSPGDKIVWSKFAGEGKAFHEDADGNRYRLLRDRDILGVVERINNG